MYVPPVAGNRPPAKGRDFSAARNRFHQPQQAGSVAPTKGGKPMTKVAHSSAPTDPETLNAIREGSEVEHARFGKGKVIKIEGKSPNTKATVFFPTAGQKQLLLKFAKLKLV